MYIYVYYIQYVYNMYTNHMYINNIILYSYFRNRKNNNIQFFYIQIIHIFIEVYHVLKYNGYVKI
jgi:hypothetical protein